MRPRRALFALLLLCALFEGPGVGYDVLRLPLALALLAALPLAGPGRAGQALLAVLILQAVSLAATADVSAGLAAVLVTAAAAGAYAAARRLSFEDAPRILAVVAGVLLAVAAWQRWKGRPPASLLGNSNYAGAFAAMLFCALAGLRHWPGAGAAAVLLALSGSRGGLVGAGAGAALLALLLWREGRRREAVVASAILMVAASIGVAAAPSRFLSPERLDTASVRLEIWKGALQLGADHAVLGAGAGGFQVAYPPYRSEVEARITTRDHAGGFPEVEDAHSSWVHSFAEGGIPGALAWLALAAFSLLRAWRAPSGQAGWAGAVAAFLAAALFNTISAHASHAVLFGVALGALEGRTERALPRPVAWLAAALLAAGALWSFARIPRDLAYHAAPAAEDRVAALRALPDWRGRFQLGQELDRQRRPAEAADAYREVLKSRPFHAVALTNLGVALIRSGDRTEGERWLVRAQEVSPHYYMTRFNLGLLRLLERRTAEARILFEGAASLNGKHGASRYGVGETYLAEGDVPGALPHLRRARETGFDVGAALQRDHPATAGDPRLAEFRR